jgi:hypothetical protein
VPLYHEDWLVYKSLNSSMEPSNVTFGKFEKPIEANLKFASECSQSR